MIFDHTAVSEFSAPEGVRTNCADTLEVNSSDSENHKGVRNIFYMAEGKGAGVWALRNEP